MKGLVPMTKNFLRKNSSTILTCAGVFGVVATAVSSAFSTKKVVEKIQKTDISDKKELFKTCMPYYIPTAMIGVSTIACIIATGHINKKQYKNLANAYAVLSTSYQDYVETLISLHGKEMDDEIVTAMAARTNPEICMCGSIESPDIKVTWYDHISDSYFERYEREIMDAEYHLNRNFIMRGYADLNEFYYFLGLEPTAYGETVGWSVTDGIYWIDFEHILLNPDDPGNPIYEVIPVFEPDEEFLREWI